MMSQYLSLAAFSVCLAGLFVWFSNGILIANILLKEDTYATAATRVKKLIITMRVVPNAIMVFMAFMLGFTFRDIQRRELPTKLYQVILTSPNSIGDLYARMGIKSKSTIQGSGN